MGRKVIKRELKMVLALFFSVITVAGLSTDARAGGRMLVPVGQTVGIDYHFKGVAVIEFMEVTDGGEKRSPAMEAGIASGDIIIMIDGKNIENADDLKNCVQSFDGDDAVIKVLRGEKEMQFSLSPALNAESGRYEMGLLLRDRMAGMGTVTFFDPESGVFGALGHAVSDVDTGVTAPLGSGTIFESGISDIIPGKPGVPGQLHGVYTPEKTIGILKANTPCGIYGHLEDTVGVESAFDALPVADESEIKPGSAVIMSDAADGRVEKYDVEILRVYTGFNTEGRTMMLKVTDERLLGITGGIVQGMSGSPIIQNGKLAGAVTHVLINDPTKGYGISIEKMMEAVGIDSGEENVA